VSTRIAAVFAGLVVAFAFQPADASASAGHHKHHKHHKHHRHHRAQPAPQAPADPPPAGPASFDGSCEFSGAVKFTPPMTTTPQTIAQHADAPGTCTGTFVDASGASHQLDNSPVRDVSESSGDAVSCEFGLASGTGHFIFSFGSIAFTLHEYRVGATPIIRFDGKTSGGSWMVITPSPSSDPVAAVQACGGAGLQEFDLDAHMQTDEPITG